MRLPPFGKQLAERQRFGNRPFLVMVCAGMDDWQRAKKWNQQPDIAAMVLPSDIPANRLHWPVQRCLVVVEWDTGPAEEQIIALVRDLLSAGAETVTVRPLFVDISQPAERYDEQAQQWVRVRESIRTYHNGRARNANVA